MKTLRLTTALALALTILSLGALTVAAQGPTQVASLDNNSHTIAAGATQLYQFNYTLNSDDSRPQMTITLPNGTNSGINFEIWTPDRLMNLANSDSSTNPADIQPIGRGTPQTVDCNTGEVAGQGGCQSPDLTWSGNFGSSGTYFVRVINTTNGQASFQLNVQGISLQPQTQTASAPAPSAPAAAPALVATVSDPTKGAAIDGQAHALPAGGFTWYKFDYALNADDSRPQVTIQLMNGSNSGVNFEVWTADRLMNLVNSDSSTNPADIQPIGRGTPMNVDCNTGEISGQGGCQSPNLVWSGNFGSSGTYYVKVINTNNATSNYQLTITVQ